MRSVLNIGSAHRIIFHTGALCGWNHYSTVFPDALVIPPNARGFDMSNKILTYLLTYLLTYNPFFPVTLCGIEVNTSAMEDVLIGICLLAGLCINISTNFLKIKFDEKAAHRTPKKQLCRVS